LLEFVIDAQGGLKKRARHFQALADRAVPSGESVRPPHSDRR
jgi:hypothetical protein